MNEYVNLVNVVATLEKQLPLLPRGVVNGVLSEAERLARACRRVLNEADAVHADREAERNAVRLYRQRSGGEQ